MKTTYNKLENSQVELIVEIDAKVWEDAQKKSFEKLAENVNAPGFRKGKVPAAIAKKQISEQSVLLESVEQVAQPALVAAVEEHNVELIARPDMEIVKLSKEECSLKFICSVKPEVKLGAYKDLGVKKTRVMVKNEEIEEEVNRVLNEQSSLELKENGSVENGDTAVIDFEGFLDNVAFEGGKGENYPLEIGSGSFIPGFEEQLIGMKSEEEKDITVTFPEQYQAENLAGKEAVFKVKVHEIRSKVRPELTDELVEELEIPDVKTAEDYKKYVKEAIRSAKSEDADNKYLEEVLEAVKNNATFEIPEVMINEEAEHMFNDFKQRVEQQGLTLELYEQLSGQKIDDIKEFIKGDAAKRVSTRLILEAVAKEENLSITDEEYEAELGRIAEMYKQEVDVIRNAIPKEAIGQEVSLRKALELLRDSNKA